METVNPRMLVDAATPHTHPPPRLLQCASSSYHMSTGRQKEEQGEKEHSRVDKEDEERQIIEADAHV